MGGTRAGAPPTAGGPTTRCAHQRIAHAKAGRRRKAQEGRLARAAPTLAHVAQARQWASEAVLGVMGVHG